MVKKRNLLIGILLTIVTFGIYVIYWLVSTKREIVELGGDVPTSWLVIIPIVNLYWLYKYMDAFAKIVKHESSGILYFILWLVFWPIVPAMIQSGLNSVVSETSTLQPANDQESASQEATSQEPVQTSSENQNNQ